MDTAVVFRSLPSSPSPFLSLPSLSKPLLPLSLNPNPLKPNKPPFLSIRASNSNPNPSPSPKTLIPPLSSLFKHTLVAATAAAAVFLARHSLASPSPAPATPAAQSETLSDAEKESAVEAYLVSNPDDPRALRALMELKVAAGKIDEAISIVDRIIPLELGQTEMPLLKAHLLCYAGDTEAARLGFETLLSQDPFLVEAYHGLIMAQRESEGNMDGIAKRVADVMEICKKEKRKEEFRDFKLLMAQIRVIEGKYEEALKIYEELVKEEPRDYRPYLCQGIIYTLLRKKGEAEKQFQKYRRLVPKGHPYAKYFEENVTAMKLFAQVQEGKRKDAVKI